MQEVSAIYTIRSRYNTLSVKEKIIADFILQNPRESVNPSIEELADRIGISESTMVRFAKKLGYSGYQRFRIALARETVPSSSQIFETEVSGSDDITEIVFQNACKNITNTYSALNKLTFREAAAIIGKARRFYLMGLGGSNIIAMDAFHKLIRIGLDCHYASDFHMQMMLASQAGSSDAALLISHTGVGNDTLALAEELQNNGCPIIVLTGNTRSPLARMGTKVLGVSAGGSHTVAESFSARYSSLVLIDALYLQILENMEDRGMENLNRMRKAIANRRL